MLRQADGALLVELHSCRAGTKPAKLAKPGMGLTYLQEAKTNFYGSAPDGSRGGDCWSKVSRHCISRATTQHLETVS